METKWIFNSRNNLPEQIKDGAYVINLGEYTDAGTYWIALFCRKSKFVYFESFGVEHVPEETKEFIDNKDIKANIFLVQANDSIAYVTFALDSLILCLQVKN